MNFNRTIPILSLILTVDIAYGINIHRTRVIKLKKVDSANLIVVELDSAIISMEYDRVIQQINKLKRKTIANRDVAARINKVSDYLSVAKSYSFNLTSKQGLNDIDKMDIAAFLTQYVFSDLVRTSSRIGLYDKALKKTQDKMICNYYKVDMSGERHEGYNYEFIDGRLFLERPISI